MTPRPQQNPAAALGITLALLGALVAAGLLCAEWKTASADYAVQAFFVQVPTSRHTPEPSRIAPIAPTIELQVRTDSAVPLPPLPQETDMPEPLPEASAPEPLLIVYSGIEAPPPAPAPPRHTPPPNTPQESVATTPPSARQTPPPPYPPQLRASRRNGTVRVRIHIDTNGQPTAVDILAATHPAFATAARQCILSSWLFSPARRGAQAIPSTAVQTLYFTG